MCMPPDMLRQVMHTLIHDIIVMCGYTPLTIRETETLMSNDLYI